MSNANVIARIGDASVASVSNPGAGTQVVFQQPNGNAASVTLPGDGRFDGKPFVLRASGRITTGVSMQVNVGLQQGGSTTAASNATLANPVATVNGSVSFVIEAMLIADSTSQQLSGIVYGNIGGTAIAQAAVTPVSNFNPNAKTTGSVPQPPASIGNPFVVTVTFAVGNAGNAAVLSDFSLEAL